MDDRVILPDDFIGTPLQGTCINQTLHPYLDEVLITQEDLKRRVQCMAEKIQQIYGSENLGLICVLNGAFRFFSMLTEFLVTMRQRLGAMTYFDFIRLKSYVNDASGDITVGKLLPVFKGMHTLIVEDIVDTGRTLEKLCNIVKIYKPTSVKTITLLVKRLDKKPIRNADFVGFEVPNRFVVGFGYDYNEHFRDLPHVCVLSEKGRAKYALAKD